MNTWLLPEHIEDLLPHEAQKLEQMRRQVLDIFYVHGYELVMPPLLEYVESLLSSGGHSMDLKTFKLVDQLSGRMMGIRADTTPQVARIDAHLLNRQGIVRLCYAGSVLHTLPAGINQSRQPFQVGAELYGYKGLEADIEIQQLMIDVLKSLSVKELQLDIGHPVIFYCLLETAGVETTLAGQILNAMQAKDVPALKILVSSLPKGTADALLALPLLYGGVDILKQAAQLLPKQPAISEALHQLEVIAAHFEGQGIKVSIDLAELSGFEYERGVVFAAFAPGAADAIARGGRYDEVGKVFGRARPATGFSLDLKALLPLVEAAKSRPGIIAPQTDNADLQASIAALRASGEKVVMLLESSAHIDELNCDRELKLIAGQWQVIPLH